jgi:hypothetical protein
MKVGELRTIIAHVPDDAEIRFADGNFGGPGNDLSPLAFEFLDGDSLVLIDPPYWSALED